MNYIYKLKVDEKIVDGYFFYDIKFGFFFFTKPFKGNLNIPKFTGLKVLNDEVTLINSLDFNSYSYNIDDNNIYIFALYGTFDKYNINILTFDDLSNSGEISYDTIMQNLAKIVKMPTGNFVCANVQDYISTIESIKLSLNHEAFFRGHYSYKFELIPSLYRKKGYYDKESFMYMDFKTQFYKELANKKYIEILTTMQHFKMPTRLLDTTNNPLVALYMATDKPTNYKNKGFDCGEVIIMHEDKRNIKYSDSNAVTLLSSLAVLETNFKQELYKKIKESIEKKDKSIYQNSIAYKRFVAEVRNELAWFDESFFTPEVLLKPRHVKVGMINERIIAQSGSFILFGLVDYQTGEYNKLNTTIKQRIFITNKEHIIKQLNMLNINDGTMYPDKDHISVAITKNYDF